MKKNFETLVETLIPFTIGIFKLGVICGGLVWACSNDFGKKTIPSIIFKVFAIIMILLSITSKVITHNIFAGVLAF